MCVLCEIQVHKHRVLYDVHILKNETAEQQQQQEKKLVLGITFTSQKLKQHTADLYYRLD